MTKILVLAEHDNNSLSGATLSVIKAAEMLGDEIDLICTTSNISNLETCLLYTSPSPRDRG